jgi:hypothetical protein
MPHDQRFEALFGGVGGHTAIRLFIKYPSSNR